MDAGGGLSVNSVWLEISEQQRSGGSQTGDEIRSYSNFASQSSFGPGQGVVQRLVPKRLFAFFAASVDRFAVWHLELGALDPFPGMSLPHLILFFALLRSSALNGKKTGCPSSPDSLLLPALRLRLLLRLRIPEWGG